MFYESSQREKWILKSSVDIRISIACANKCFIEQQNERHLEFLTVDDEITLQLFYSQFVYEICRKFKPPVPSSVIAISLTYFKRFYLNTSVMEYHPRELACLSVYLACKVDEYNVSIDQFMGQLQSTPNIALQTFIIDNEFLLLQKLNYHLTVHSPFRPVEGFIIDLKTRANQLNIEKHRTNIEKFLISSLLTDALLLFPPSQIALAALSYSLDSGFEGYLKSVVSEEKLDDILEKCKSIKQVVLQLKIPSKADVHVIEEKLKVCRDYENDPYSNLYHERETQRKEEKDRIKKKKYQELYEMQYGEENTLGAKLD